MTEERKYHVLITDETKKTVFVCYSAKDVKWLDRILTSLQALHLNSVITPWSDQDIPAGDLWRQETEKRLNTAHAAVLILSVNFLASDFIKNVDIPILLQRYHYQGVKLFPVLVRPCPWEKIPWLNQLQTIMLKSRQPLSEANKSNREKKLAELAIQVEQWLFPSACATTPTLTD